MDSAELVEKAKKIRQRVIESAGDRHQGHRAEVCEFLRIYGGRGNSFLERADQEYGLDARQELSEILTSLIHFVGEGLHADISPEDQARNDVVSDFLEQADILLKTSGVHAAAPVVLVGATLEEFLRTWVEREGLQLGGNKPSLSSFSTLLKDADLITKQDGKDITSWGGLRNEAAHGNWDEVKDPQRARVMLEGVNLFIRKYSQ